VNEDYDQLNEFSQDDQAIAKRFAICRVAKPLISEAMKEDLKEQTKTEFAQQKAREEEWIRNTRRRT